VIKKMAAYTQVSGEDLKDALSLRALFYESWREWSEATPEQRAQWEAAARVARQAEQERRGQEHATFASSLSGTLREIAEHHAPDEYGDCRGCDGEGDDRPSWPCSTTEILRGAKL
jgi:hypothetical protein